MRQGIGRRGHGAEQTIDPHAHHEAVPERFDVYIAGTELQGFFEQVVDRADHRGAARQIAETFNVVLGSGARGPPVPGRWFLAAKLLAENSRDILEGGDLDQNRCAKDDFGGADSGGVARVGDGKLILTFWQFEGEHRSVAQESRRKASGQGRRGNELGQGEPLQAIKLGDFIGESIRGELGQLPKFAKGSFRVGRARGCGVKYRVRKQIIFVRQIFCEVFNRNGTHVDVSRPMNLFPITTGIASAWAVPSDTDSVSARPHPLSALACLAMAEDTTLAGSFPAILTRSQLSPSMRVYQ